MKNAIVSIAKTISDWTHGLLLDWGVSEQIASWINMAFLLALAVLVIYGVLYLTKFLLHILFVNVAKATRMPFFRFIVRNRFPILFARLLPYVIIKAFIPIVFYDFPFVERLSNMLVEIWFIFLIISIIISLVRSGTDLLAMRPAYHDKPMTSYIQVIQIILYIIGIVLAFSILTGKSPTVFLGAMGAASAIMLLVFQDSIKGFVASIQVTSNDLVRLGDWITVPKYGADGDVIEINLTTVKVQNFDKTISTLPTYSLISDSFQNWRGMQNASGRRIKRSLLIKQSSIRFLADEELPRFEKIQGLTSYIKERQKEIEKHNKAIGADRSVRINGRNLTNAGLFRQYTEWYLRTHPGIKPEYTMMVRQLDPTPNGIPFEIYVFTNTIVWTEYEGIMSDIFDHLIASVEYFDLQIFEFESGGDIKHVDIESHPQQTPKKKEQS